MRTMRVIYLFMMVLVITEAGAQTYYVDAKSGDDSNSGSHQAPFLSLQRAVEVANISEDLSPVVVKLNPGLYILQDILEIRSVKTLTDSRRYIIEATVMPDDPEWTPQKMPVIQSISANNSTVLFPHATGLLIASSHVTVRGLKFLGNNHPMVDYYYPISKEDSTLSDLEVAQCYFIGHKESAKIQGGVWAHGPENTISHCIFYGCRNGVLFFDNVEGFTIEYSIIYGSYESAFWFSRQDYGFTFTNNIVANNANFLVKPQQLTYSSPFSNSVITGNSGFVGYWSREDQAVKPIANPDIILNNTKTTGSIVLYENNQVQLDKNHLHLKNDGEEHTARPGIFRIASE